METNRKSRQFLVLSDLSIKRFRGEKAKLSDAEITDINQDLITSGSRVIGC